MLSNTVRETAADWLVRLREDSLSDTEMAEWIAWCEAHPSHLEAFEELQSLWRAAGDHPPSAELVSRLLHGKPRERWGSRPVWAIAASVIVMTGAAGYFWTAGPWENSGQRIEHIAAVDQVKTPQARNRAGTLPDGSHVDLGARTVLDVDFSGAERQLELRDGQAFFQVKQDKVRPFVVSAGEVRIVALGTAFDVRRTARQVAVTVQEGTVQMVKADGEALIATAGYQLIYNPGDGAVRKSLVDPAMATAWRSGRLEFTGDPLEVVIASVNRYAGTPVTLEDANLASLTFTGTVFIDSIDASLDAMEQVFPIEVRRTETQTVLVRR